MRTQTRIGLALAGIVVLIVAAALVSGLTGGEDSGPASEVTAATGATGWDEDNGDAGSTSASGSGGDGGVAPKPGPGPLLKAGAIKVIEVSRGETVRFRAVSAGGDELHVHGYNLSYQLPPGKRVKVEFEADLEGVFDIEMHNGGGHVGELRVNP